MYVLAYVYSHSNVPTIYMTLCFTIGMMGGKKARAHLFHPCTDFVADHAMPEHPEWPGNESVGAKQARLMSALLQKAHCLHIAL